MCRKVAESTDGTIEVWGDGSAVRSFIYVDDLVEGVRRLVDSDVSDPTNIGTREYVSVRELVDLSLHQRKRRSLRCGCLAQLGCKIVISPMTASNRLVSNLHSI